MSENDIDLKLASRRLAWNQGHATKVNVPLRSYVERRAGRPGVEEYTDLDVLAISTSPSGRVQFQIFDCKSTSSRTTERTFWLRGVADFFGASDAWMLRPENVTDASRQLAARLDLGVLTGKDLDTLAAIAASGALTPTGTPAVERLFDPTVIEKVRASRTQIDKRLRNLVDYCSYDYWVYEPYQNLAQMVAHLRGAARAMDGRAPVHHAVLFDCIWLYSLSLARASDYVRRTNASSPYNTLLEYFLGGQVAIREKEMRLKELQRLGAGPESSIEPDYFRQLVETFARMYVTPKIFTTVMRYCEVAVVNLVDNRRPYLSNALGTEYDPVAAKLLYDLGGFLISSARLSPSFRESVREITLGTRREHTNGDTSRSEHDAGTQLSIDDGGNGSKGLAPTDSRSGDSVQ